jgi:hypothetical protein
VRVSLWLDGIRRMEVRCSMCLWVEVSFSSHGLSEVSSYVHLVVAQS